MQHLEQKVGDITFVRVDSDTSDNLVQKDEVAASVLSEKEETSIKTIFEGVVGESMGTTVVTKALSPDDQPIVITRPEFMRRMKEMQSMQGGGFGAFPDSYNVCLLYTSPSPRDATLSRMPSSA